MLRPKPRKCVVCFEREPVGIGNLCTACGKHYDKHGEGDSSIIAVIIWAAERARSFERRRR